MQSFDLKQKLKKISNNLIKTTTTIYQTNICKLSFETEFELIDTDLEISINYSQKQKQIKITDDGHLYLALANQYIQSTNTFVINAPLAIKVIQPVLEANHCQMIDEHITIMGDIEQFESLWTNIISCIIQLKAYQRNSILKAFQK